MFNFIKKLFRKNDEDSPEYRTAFIARIKDKKIKYLTERFENPETGEVTDLIIGREGVFHVNPQNELLIYCGGTDALFRAPVAEVSAHEFMSLEGVIIEAFDLTQNKQRQIIAYYKYHRK